MAYTTINKSQDHFNVVIYTGDGTSSRNITGVGFKPDWVWLKQRNTTRNHALTDSVRGVNKQLYTNLNSTESTDSGTVTGFISDGFTVGSDNQANQNSGTFVSWNWLAANGTASDTNGSITSTVSANTTSGFSIVSFTGTGAVATIGHGLGVAPKMIIIKRRSGGTEAWPVDCRQLGGTLYLNETGTLQSYGDTSPIPSTAPTSNVFSVGSAPNGNASGSTMIAYCFADKKGFSQFGSYTGNGSTNGTFVYTGFKPAWVMAKKTNGSGSWRMWDNKREGYNGDNAFVYANLSNAEESDGTLVDFCSQGFKWRGSSQDMNGSGGSYIYMAFAENPFVTSTGIPATAR